MLGAVRIQPSVLSDGGLVFNILGHALGAFERAEVVGLAMAEFAQFLGGNLASGTASAVNEDGLCLQRREVLVELVERDVDRGFQ